MQTVYKPILPTDITYMRVGVGIKIDRKTDENREREKI